MSRIDLPAVAEAAFAPVRAALADGRIPGAALGLVTAAGGRAALAEGLAQRVPAPEPLDRATLFDLASLTKVMVTTVEVLRLVEDGRADLDDSIAKHLPELRAAERESPLRRFTLRQLLSHQTGIVAHERIYEWGGGPEELRRAVLARDWPVGAPVYSDVNFILLGFAVERLRGRGFAELPVGGGLTFRPDPARTAATEDDPWRGRVLRGEVHDENACALGGAAGHAGLFGTVDGVLDFAHALLAGRVLSPAAMAELRRSRSGARALGWEAKAPSWAGGSLCSPETIGHTGFTGTGLWVDVERGLAWTLLTNRVHPSRHAETGIMDLRRSVGNIVAARFAR